MAPLLEERHRADLQRSGLTDYTIEKLGFRSCLNDEGRRLLGWPDEMTGDLTGMVIPYPGSSYVKVKPDRPRPRGPTKRPSREFTDHNYLSRELEPEQFIKYEAPLGQSPSIYSPIDFCPAIGNQAVQLFLTEGEKKCALLCQEGIPCLGLSGVSAGHDREEREEGEDLSVLSRPLSAGITRFIRDRRPVTVLFDSPDMLMNPSVIRAAVGICKELLDLQAKPMVGYVPTVPGLAKCGVDDYFMAPRESNSRLLEGGAFSHPRPSKPNELLKWLLAQRADWLWDPETLRLHCQEAATWVRIWHEDEPRLWRSWVTRATKQLRVSEMVFMGAMRRLGVQDPQGPTPREYVADWISKRGSYDYRVNSLRVGDEDLASNSVYDKICLDANEEGLRLKPVLLNQALNEWLMIEKEKVVAAQREKILRPAVSNQKEILNFVRALTGKESNLDVAVLLHFVWQVKRKLAGKSVDYHLMPVLFGKQNAGKSTAVRHLIQPVELLSSNPSTLAAMADAREMVRLAERYVVFVDEMAHADRVDVRTLKTLITSETVEWRPMGTNQVVKKRNTATFIACTNEPLSQILYDPTGMRRFYQVDVLPKVDHAAINSVDVDALWSSVDVDARAPIIPFLDELSRRQDCDRAKDSIEEWVEECCVVNSGKWMPAGAVYASFTAWLERLRRKPMTQTSFGRRLKQLQVRGVAINTKKTNSCTEYDLSFKMDTMESDCIDNTFRHQSRNSGLHIGAGAMRAGPMTSQ